MANTQFASTPDRERSSARRARRRGWLALALPLAALLALVLVPAVAIHDGAGVFLNALSPADLTASLGVPVRPVESSPSALAAALLGR